MTRRTYSRPASRCAERPGERDSGLGAAARHGDCFAQASAGRFEVLDVPTPLARHLASFWVRQGDFLLAEIVDNIDLVIGNPPYIRIEDLPAEITAEYRRRWVTMGGRADIYVGFVERCLRLLAPDGKIGFIVADRWMRNQYGASLRMMISEGYSLDVVWQAHDVDAFDQQVNAYPAFTVMRRGQQGSVVAAE